MTTRKAKKGAQVRKYFMKHPFATSTQAADIVGVSKSYAAAVRRRLRGLQVDLNGALRVEGDGAEYEQKDGAWRVVSVSTSNESIKPAEPVEQAEADMVNHPPHYTYGGIETIEFIKAKLTPEEFKGYLKGNILKYGSRVGHKGDPAQDAGKLAWYATKYAESV